MELAEQLLERDVLVVEGAEADIANAFDELGERRVTRDVGAQDERVQEHPDQSLELLADSPGDGSADEDVVVVDVAGDEHVERGEQHHERRRAEASAASSRTPAPVAASSVCSNWPLWNVCVGGRIEVGRYLGRRERTGERVAPVIELPVAVLTGHPRALPCGVVDVLDRKLGERRRATAR